MRQQELFLRSGLKVEGFGVFLEGFGFSPSRISFFFEGLFCRTSSKALFGQATVRFSQTPSGTQGFGLKV